MSKEGTVVLLGGGAGREEAIADGYLRNPDVRRVIVGPRNSVLGTDPNKPPVEIFPELSHENIPRFIEICKEENAILVDVAHDGAVEAGVVDAVEKLGIPVVGPTQNAARLETSKAWAREHGERHGVPQPGFEIFHSQEDGINYLKKHPDQKKFVKASGLAQGKGAIPAKNRKEAIQAVREMERFGPSGQTYLIEEWLEGDDGTPGEEYSVFVVSDGTRYKMLGVAQDHKRLLNGDEGPNTGGMGCSGYPLGFTEDLLIDTQINIVPKILNGMSQEGIPYKGVLYIAEMAVTRERKLKNYVIEENARHGDPEAQIIIPGLTTDLFTIGMAVANGDIGQLDIKSDDKSRVVVALTSKGYPDNYNHVKGKEIFGIDDARKVQGVRVYGGGVHVEDGKYYANGGRLLYVVGEGKDVIEARGRAYEALSRIQIDGNLGHFRTDIGWRDVQRLRTSKTS